jgi:hypothetical protein
VLPSWNSNYTSDEKSIIQSSSEQGTFDQRIAVPLHALYGPVFGPFFIPACCHHGTPLTSGPDAPVEVCELEGVDCAEGGDEVWTD